jgi:hypothetical protein
MASGYRKYFRYPEPVLLYIKIVIYRSKVVEGSRGVLRVRESQKEGKEEMEEREEREEGEEREDHEGIKNGSMSNQ